MHDVPIIRSRAHPALKRVRAARAGKEPDLLVLEGDRLVEDARATGLGFEELLVAAGREARAAELAAAGLAVRVVADEALAGVSGLTTPPGILALVRAPRPAAGAGLEADPDALVLVIAGVADPGNLGAIARSAEAAGARAVCALAGGASPWNEKALRGSMGSLLRLPVHRLADAGEARAALAGHRHVRAATRGGTPWRSFDWSGPLALWVSGETGEAAGATEAGALEPVTIPLAPGPESLNVTVAASLLLFAAGRVEAAR